MLFLLALACPLPDLSDRDGDGANDQVDCDDGDPEVGRRCPARCEAGWGPILEVAPNADLVVPRRDDVTVLHVWPDGPTDGRPADDGRVRQPFRDLDLALRRARELDGEVVVALSAGSYAVNASLYRESEEAAVGPRIVGCSADEVIVEPVQPDRPVFEVRAQDLDPFDGNDARWDVQIRGLTVRGGRRAVRAVGSVDLDLQDLRVEDAEFYGIQGYGRQVRLGLTDVQVTGVRAYTPPLPGAVSIGAGVGALRGAVIEAAGLTVDGAVGVGVVVLGETAASVQQRIATSTIRDVVPTGTRLGRGLVADGLMDLRVSQLTVEQVHDAAVFVRNVGTALIDGVSVDAVQPADAPDGPADGVVFVQDAYVFPQPSPFTYTIRQLDSVDDPARAAVVASGSVIVVAEKVTDTVIRDNGADVQGATFDDAPPTFELDLEELPDDPPN